MSAGQDGPLLRLVVAAAGSVVLLGCMHIVALFAGLGLSATLALSLVAAAGWLWYWFRNGDSGLPDRRLLIVVTVVTAAACILIKEHGAYDAWLHWNSLARYMTDPVFFSALRRPDSLWHADYPPGLPAPVALVWRLLHSDPEWVPRLLSFTYYLTIPVLLCREAFREVRFRWLWLAVLALFTVNYECLSQGLNQYADIPLALLFLLALKCRESAVASADTRWHLACGLMLGGCLLMKNEGMLLVFAFLLSRGRGLFDWKSSLRVLAGVLVPLCVLIAYKQHIANPNDVIAGVRRNPLAHLLEWERYRLIAFHAFRFAVLRFPVYILFFGWGLWVLRKRLKPGADAACIALCAAGYLLIYLTTDIGLEWLVPTSLNRLMMQLLPASVYLLIRRLRSAETAAAKQSPSAQNEEA